jgi:hypothetical protein
VASVPAVVHFTSFGADASGAKAGRGAPKARNYLDKNYGGVLLIWDHLFGSYQAERSDIPIRYGLAHPRSAPNNPFVIAYEDVLLTLKLVTRPGTTRERLARLCGPP